MTVCGQEGRPQKYQSIGENQGIRQSSVSRTIQDVFRAIHTEKDNVSIRTLMYSQVM